jgi:uncharacterized protein
LIVDVHTHLFWYPDHLSDELVDEALAAKRVKLETSGGRAYAKSLDRHSNDARPEDHLPATAAADRVIVFGLRAPATGFNSSNEVVAEYAAQHPDRMEGWASIDPNDADCLDQLRYCVDELGLKGLKVGPTYQHFDPRDPKFWPLFTECERRDLPVMIHMGTTYPSRARLEFAKPLLLEPLIMAHPGLRMIIAHLAHPWEEDAVVLVRKSPRVFADISALHFRPWRFWQALTTAAEYGVTHKLLLGSDFPNGTTADAIEALHGVNDIVEGSRLPRFPEAAQEAIVHSNWARFFGAS